MKYLITLSIIFFFLGINVAKGHSEIENLLKQCYDEEDYDDALEDAQEAEDLAKDAVKAID